MLNNLNPSTSGASPSPQQLETAPETWITTSEVAAILHLTLRTVLSHAASGKLPAKIPDDIPFTYDGKQNYLIRLEGLPQKTQFEYLQKRLPADQRCGLDLATPRSSFGDAWLSTFLNVAQLICDVEQIRQRYRHSGKATAELSRLAAANGIALSTLCRLCGKRKLFAPSSLTVTVSGRFICEAFPAQKLPPPARSPLKVIPSTSR